MLVEGTVPTENGCMVAAFAYVLDLSIEELVRRIGHDGQRQVKYGPGLTAPVGYNVQEIIEVVLLTHSVTEIAEVTIGAEDKPIPVLGLDVKHRIKRAQEHFDGVIVTKMFGQRYHALAWDSKAKLYYDPNTAKPFDANKVSPIMFWAVEQRKGANHGSACSSDETTSQTL